jgi:transcriptional regulator NrdR family protein
MSNGIECENCGSTRTFVINTRDYGKARYRRRKCIACTKRFSTLELSMTHVKRSKKLVEIFDLSKGLAR